MPACMTSLLRELVPTPIASAASSTITSRPRAASARATASPTTPAPITTHSIWSMSLDAADFATRRLVHPCRWQQHAANERRTPLAAERTAVLRPFYNGHPTAASNCTTPRARRCAPAVSSGSASCGHLQFLAGMDSGCLEADRPATVAEVEPDVAAADLVASVDARR